MKTKTYMQSKQALGTVVELRLVTSREAEAEEWFKLLWKEVAVFENNFSRFKPDSELSVFNMHAGENMPVSKTLSDILKRAKQFGELTDGIFNPFILPSLQRAGYIHSMVTMRKDAPVYTDREVFPYTELEIGDDWARIPANSALDLGGIGKGYLADYLASMLQDLIQGYCLSLGGDMLVKGRDEHDAPWHIDIQSSKDRTHNSAYFVSEEDVVGVATSGLIREKEGRKQGHQINPGEETPQQASYVFSSVASKNATTADVMASSILLGGVTLAKRLIEKGVVSAVFLQDEASEESILLGKGFTLL